MREKIDVMLIEGNERIAGEKTEAELQDVKSSLLGKKGSLTDILKEIPNLDVLMRAEIGRATNNLKDHFTALIESRREEIRLKASEIPPDFDFTVPGGTPHPNVLRVNVHRRAKFFYAIIFATTVILSRAYQLSCHFYKMVFLRCSAALKESQYYCISQFQRFSYR